MAIRDEDTAYDLQRLVSGLQQTLESFKDKDKTDTAFDRKLDKLAKKITKAIEDRDITTDEKVVEDTIRLMSNSKVTHAGNNDARREFRSILTLMTTENKKAIQAQLKATNKQYSPWNLPGRVNNWVMEFAQKRIDRESIRNNRDDYDDDEDDYKKKANKKKATSRDVSYNRDDDSRLYDSTVQYGEEFVGGVGNLLKLVTNIDNNVGRILSASLHPAMTVEDVKESQQLEQTKVENIKSINTILTQNLTKLKQTTKEQPMQNPLELGGLGAGLVGGLGGLLTLSKGVLTLGSRLVPGLLSASTLVIGSAGKLITKAGPIISQGVKSLSKIAKEGLDVSKSFIKEKVLTTENKELVKDTARKTGEKIKSIGGIVKETGEKTLDKVKSVGGTGKDILKKGSETAMKGLKTVGKLGGKVLGPAGAVVSGAFALSEYNDLVSEKEKELNERNDINEAEKKRLLDQFKSNQKKTAGGKVAGAAIGTAVGGLIGSVIPGAGTIIGAGVGGIAGEWIGDKLASFFHKNEEPIKIETTEDISKNSNNETVMTNQMKRILERDAKSKIGSITAAYRAKDVIDNGTNLGTFKTKEELEQFLLKNGGSFGSAYHNASNEFGTDTRINYYTDSNGQKFCVVNQLDEDGQIRAYMMPNDEVVKIGRQQKATRIETLKQSHYDAIQKARAGDITPLQKYNSSTGIMINSNAINEKLSSLPSNPNNVAVNTGGNTVANTTNISSMPKPKDNDSYRQLLGGYGAFGSDLVPSF